MTRPSSILLAAIFLAAAIAPAAAQKHAPVAAKETTIEFGSNGGLRDWQRVTGEPDRLFVRDRTDRWYKVRLSGPCARYAVGSTMTYTTDTLGTFDRFSQVTFPHQTLGTCRVTSIVRSEPPPQFRSRPAR